MKDLKKTARISMKGKWLQGAAICLSLWIPGLLTGIFEFSLRWILKLPAFWDNQANCTPASMAASLGCGILCFLLWAPLSIGTIRWYWQEHTCMEPRLRTVLFHFESYPSYLKATGMWVSISLRIFMWYILFSSPWLLTKALLLWQEFRTGLPLQLDSIYLLFSMVLTVWPILALLLTSIVCQRYLLAPRFLAQSPDEPVRRLIKRSVRFMQGYQSEAFLLQLSFFPWYLPGIASIVVLISSFHWVGYDMWLLPISGALLLIHGLLGFYLKPWKHAVLARYSGQLLYGDIASQDENITREYVAGDETLLQPAIPPTLGTPGLP